jgi:hypothetical protein
MSAFVACSSSDTTSAATGGAGGAAAGSGGTVDGGSGAAGSGASSAGAGGNSAGSGGGTLVDAGVNMCTSASDTAALHADYADGGDAGVVIFDIATECTIQCISNADFPSCATPCIVQKTGNKMSSGCAGCITASVQCSIGAGCAGACMGDPNAAACTACQCGANNAGINCIGAFDTCAGVSGVIPCGGGG